jgi:hypothetical protein
MSPGEVSDDFSVLKIHNILAHDQAIGASLLDLDESALQIFFGPSLQECEAYVQPLSRSFSRFGCEHLGRQLWMPQIR